MECLITIIVPIFNVEKYISKCLQSIIEQSYKNIEVLAIDDGSTDSSATIVNKYSEIDNRIILVKKENGGYGSVLELGIRSASGEYILICDPDDWLDKDCVKTLVQATRNCQVDIVVGDKIDVLESGETLTTSQNNKYFPIKPDTLYEKGDVGKLAFQYCSPHSKLYRRKMLDDIHFPHHVSFTDVLLYLVALSRAKNAIYVDKKLSFYLINRPGNTATDKSVKALKNHFIVWKATREQVDRKNIYITYRSFCSIKSFLSFYINNIGFKNDQEKLYLTISQLLKSLKPDVGKNVKKVMRIKDRIMFFFFSNKHLLRLFLKTRRHI